MRPPGNGGSDLNQPKLLRKARQLAGMLQKLTKHDIESMMNISPKMAEATRELIAQWNVTPSNQRAAVDSFLGDIYSGLQVQSWSESDRDYANEHLRIVSGLYGILKPLDGIYPYRLEMGYKIPNQAFKTMYEFWGTTIADTLDERETVINLTAVEYGKTVTKYVDESRVVTPKFLTVSPKTGEPIFVTVHAKIARGAFARWLIVNRIDDERSISAFADLGYVYDSTLSSVSQPVFICREFNGLGLSVRLSEETKYVS